MAVFRIMIGKVKVMVGKLHTICKAIDSCTLYFRNKVLQETN